MRPCHQNKEHTLTEIITKDGSEKISMQNALWQES